MQRDKNAIRYFFFVLCVIVSGCGKTGTVMNVLIPDPYELSENCALVQVEKEIGLPFKVSANPTLSRDRAFISSFAGSVFDNQINPKHIREALFSVYDEKEELYVFAFDFIDVRYAKEAEEMIFYSFPDLLPIRKDHIIVVIWHDGSEHRCFKRIYNLVKQKLENMVTSQ